MVESQYVHRHCVPKAASGFIVDSKIEGQQPAAETGQQPAAKCSRTTRKSSGSIQPPGAAASRQGQHTKGQQPAARGSRSNGTIQSPGAADRRAAASRQGQVPGIFPGGKGGRCVRLTTLPPSCAVVTKSGDLNILEPSRPLSACNGTALPLPITSLLVLYPTLHCEPRPLSHASLAVGLSTKCTEQVRTHMTFLLEACFHLESLFEEGQR